MANEIWKTFPPVRRVVTGHDANNVAKVLIDAPATNAKGTEGRSTLMWITDQNPADMPVGEKIEDMGARIVGTPPPPNGTRFCVIRSEERRVGKECSAGWAPEHARKK